VVILLYPQWMCRVTVAIWKPNRANPSNWGHNLTRRIGSIPQVPPRIHRVPGRSTNLDGRDPTPPLPRIEDDRLTPSRPCIEDDRLTLTTSRPCIQDGRDPTPPLSHIGDSRDGPGRCSRSVRLGLPFDANPVSIVFGERTAEPGSSDVGPGTMNHN
jgi:hypothetical protein